MKKTAKSLSHMPPRGYVQFLFGTYPQGVASALLAKFSRTGDIPDVWHCTGEPFRVREDYYDFLAANPA